MIRLLAALLLCAAGPAWTQKLPLERTRLPPGFRIEVPDPVFGRGDLPDQLFRNALIL